MRRIGRDANSAEAQGEPSVEPPSYFQTRRCRICPQSRGRRLRYMFGISVLSGNKKPPSAVGIFLLIP